MTDIDKLTNELDQYIHRHKNAAGKEPETLTVAAKHRNVIEFVARQRQRLGSFYSTPFSFERDEAGNVTMTRYRGIPVVIL